jgi:hypothetical protein
MFGNRMKSAFLAAAVIAMFVFSGCILSPNEEVPPPQSKPTYKALTDKENIIYNLVQCYKDRNKDRFVELLHDDYIWYNQVGETPEYLDRTQDITQTGKLFDAVENQPNIKPELWLELLDLWIDPQGYWLQIYDVEEVPCSDCWETTRHYTITARANGGTTTWVGDDLVKFLAMGVDRNGQRIYLLRRADDIKKPEGR